jgi:threonine dehydrogenase-like Zn-dependent dehydrogenase
LHADDGLAQFASRGVDVVIDAFGGPLTGQAIGGLARCGSVVVMGYAAGTETTVRVTDLVWHGRHLVVTTTRHPNGPFGNVATTDGTQAESEPSYSHGLKLISKL